MGNVNVQTKEYMRDNAKFADLCNYFLYNGQEKIVAENLQELDVTELASVFTDKGVVTQEKLRDLLKSCTVKTTDDVVYFLVGIENQTDIHYAMVVRNLLMDAMNYSNQADTIAKNHRTKKDVKGDEFLSGFSKSDKLTPVITITVYWGSGEWDGPRTLHEMLNCPEELLSYVPDYKMNLIVPRVFSLYHW